MTCIGTAYGASPLTFLGLAGVGDLFLTCSSPTSRNYTVGFRLGKGESLKTIIDTLGSVAEGVSSAKGLKSIIDELGVNAPIANGVGNRSDFDLVMALLIIVLRYMTCCMKVDQGARDPLRRPLIFFCPGKDVHEGLQELLSLPPSRELELPE
jgi:hypothetical protein